MNNFLQENLFALVLFLLIIILLLIAIIAIVLVKLLLSAKDQKSFSPVIVPTVLPTTESPAPRSGEILSKIKKLAEEHVTESFFCKNHPDNASIGACLICEDVFCEKCLIESDGLCFCKDHFKTFVNNKWSQITDVKTTPATPEEGMFIYQYKRQIWRDRDVPSFVLTHYKINIEHDYIESYIQLNVITSKAEDLKTEIESFRQKKSLE